MTSQQLTIAGMMITIVILFILIHISWRQRSRLGDLLQMARDEASDVYDSYNHAKNSLEIERDNHSSTRKRLGELELRHAVLKEEAMAQAKQIADLRRRMGPIEEKPAPAPAQERRSDRPAPATAGSYYDAKTDSYVRRGQVDDGSGLLQTAILVSAFDDSPAREKEIMDAQDSSHRSAGHEPVCRPSYESRHSGGSGESHSNHSSPDSGSSGSPDSGTSGGCD